MADEKRTHYIPKLSWIVMGILDTIGVNKRIRRRRRKEWMECEQLLTNWSKKGKGFIFGSQIEGATTPGLNSDIDLVSLTNNDIAIFDTNYVMAGKNNYLMVADEDTYPGYYKLVYKPELCFSYDVNYTDITVNRERQYILKPSAFVYPLGKIHGPAATNNTDWDVPMDCIMGIRVHDWVQYAITWIQRRNRTTPGDFENFINKEAFLVPVGNPISFEEDLEWRISFTPVERELMWKLNNTQIGCYVLMKMVVKNFITPAIGECLTSYHCKTALFWLIENTDKGFWKPLNLLFCFSVLLKTILLWVRGTFCPNYFIPQENIFLGKISGQKSWCLCNILSTLLDMDFRYLTSIPCIGQVLSKACSRIYTLQLIPRDRENLLDVKQDSDVLCVKWPILWSKRLALHVYKDFLMESHSVSLQNRLTDLTKEHQSCREDVLLVWIRLLYSHLGCQLASSCFARHDLCGQEIKVAHTFLHCGTNSDVTSGRLKLAGFYLKLGYPALAEEVLTAVEWDLKHYVCDLSAVDIVDMDDAAIQKIVSEDLTTEQTYRKCLALSVIYLSSEIHCILPPLCYEMFWSECELVVVDARPCLYFLQYQINLALNKSMQRSVALENLACSLRQMRIKHYGMCLNFLAYCLRQKRQIDLGLQCLLKSLRIQPEHNGAVWQICEILSACASIIA